MVENEFLKKTNYYQKLQKDVQLPIRCLNVPEFFYIKKIRLTGWKMQK